MTRAAHRRGRAGRGGRGGRGVTMVELLVSLGILAVAIGSILSIFVAGSRFGGRSRERLEAGRVALAVFDLVDRGFTVSSTPYGRRTDGGLVDETVTSGDHLQAIDGGQPSWRPTYVAKSPVLLVWKYEVTARQVDGVDVHQLTVTVSVDLDDDFQFDGASSADPDRVVKVYEAVLADRRVAP